MTTRVHINLAGPPTGSPVNRQHGPKHLGINDRGAERWFTCLPFGRRIFLPAHQRGMPPTH